MPGSDIDSHCVPLCGEIKLEFKRDKRSFTNNKLNKCFFRDYKKILKRYRVIVSNRYKAMPRTQNMVEQCEMAKTPSIRRGKRYYQKRIQKAKKRWVAEEILNLML